MKRFLALSLTFILCFGVLSLAHAENSAEVPEGYTPIYTAEDLYNIRNDLADKYILMNDIDLSVYENWEPIGTSEAPFTGELNGNGFFIKNLKIDVVAEKAKNYHGLFGVASGSFFKNVIVENGTISVKTSKDTDLTETYSFAGMIAAKTTEENYTRVVKCSASGKIDVTGGSYVFVGGLLGAGIADNCIISSSNYTDININTENYTQNINVGGLLGGSSENKDSYSESFFRIEKSSNFGNIFINNEICSENTQIIIGGIAGFQISGNELSECYNRGNISAVKPSGKFLVGGILGEAIWRLEKSYNTGKIDVITDGNDTVSAICFIKKPYLSFSEEPVMPADFTVYNCYCLNSGLVPCTQNPDNTFNYYKNVFVLTEEEFKKQESFECFDFESVWKMEENGYPVLQNEPKITVNDPEATDTTTETQESSYVTEESNTQTTKPSDEESTTLPTETNNIVSAEIIYLPLKNRIVFGVGSPNTPEGIVIKLTYKDGSEKTEKIIRTDNGFSVGEEKIHGTVHVEVVQFGQLREVLYINDESIKVEYNYFVIPPIRYIFSELYSILYLLFRF